jgi:hypothetical protein
MSATTLTLTIESGVLDARSSWREFKSLAVQMSREVSLWALEATLDEVQERLIDSVCGPRWAPVGGPISAGSELVWRYLPFTCTQCKLLTCEFATPWLSPTLHVPRDRARSVRGACATASMSATSPS